MIIRWEGIYKTINPGMDRPFFSIVIPTLNEEQYLPLLFRDLNTQTFKNFEVIIVDANSGDKTREKAQLFRKMFDLKLLVSPKKSVSLQRNLGFNRAKGEYAIFLDADSRVPDYFLKKLKRELFKSKADFATTSMKIRSPFLLDQFLVKFINIFFKSMLLLGTPCMPGSCLIFQKQVFKFLKGFDESLFLGEDFEIAKRASRMGFKGAYFTQPCHYFSIRRIEREGKLAVGIKYIVSFIYGLFVGPIRKELFSYPMGGKI